MPNNCAPAETYNAKSKTDCHMEQKFIVIGMDDRPQPYFPPEVQELIRCGKVFSGGIRHREIVSSLLPDGARWIDITVPLDDVFARYEAHFASEGSPLLVFASGDPLFFGFANTIRRKMPTADIRLFPSFNSLQTLAHRLVMPYNDMRTVSLTGRPWQELDRALMERIPHIGLLTDREHTPDAIARRLLDYGYDGYTVYVGEHLGNPDKERIRQMSLEEASQSRFEHPNNLMLVARQALPPRPFGIPDEAFEHLDGRARMITKAPIRLLTLQALGLSGRRVMWDIGFCTGSVSIEARLQFPHLQVVAFEVRPEGRHLMEVNSRRFGVPGITALIGDFLQADLTDLPRPDAVFIGGHGGRLADMLARIREVLLPEGCIVLNSVSAESREAFCTGIRDLGMKLCPPLHVALNDYNPIDILKATF